MVAIFNNHLFGLYTLTNQWLKVVCFHSKLILFYLHFFLFSLTVNVSYGDYAFIFTVLSPLWKSLDILFCEASSTVLCPFDAETQFRNRAYL